MKLVRLGSASLRVTLLAVMLMLTAGASQADRDGARGSRRGGRSHESGSVRSKSGGGDVDRMYARSSSERRFKGDAWGGGRPNGGRSIRTWSGGGRNYGGGHAYNSGHSRTHVRRGSVAYRGGVSYYGGVRDCGPRYHRPVVYGYARPRTYVSFGIGVGSGYYCPPAYRYHDRRAPIVRETESQIDVENEPPAGCYYYDPYCERDFSNLDEYTDHIDREGHAKTIQIIERDSGDPVRTLEFVGGYWSVQR